MKKNSMLFALRNAILAWYDDSLEEYKGIDDEEFIHHVCKELGITRKEYKSIVFDGKDEDDKVDDMYHGSYPIEDIPTLWEKGLRLTISRDLNISVNGNCAEILLTPEMLMGIKGALDEAYKKDSQYHLILSNNNACDDLSVYRFKGSKMDAYKRMQAMVLATAAQTEEDRYVTVDTNSSEMSACVQWSESHEDFRVVSFNQVCDIEEADGVADANLDAIPDDINWDEDDVQYYLHDVGRDEEPDTVEQIAGIKEELTDEDIEAIKSCMDRYLEAYGEGTAKVKNVGRNYVEFIFINQYGSIDDALFGVICDDGYPDVFNVNVCSIIRDYAEEEEFTDEDIKKIRGKA